jgi:hypothetical protein
MTTERGARVYVAGFRFREGRLEAGIVLIAESRQGRTPGVTEPGRVRLRGAGIQTASGGNRMEWESLLMVAAVGAVLFIVLVRRGGG